MKVIFRHFSIVIISLLGSIVLHAQGSATTDSTGLPVDNFDLQGALQLFQQAGSPEDFEKLLNDEANAVNNLDLDEDGKTDYVRVIDQSNGDAHAFVLQVSVSGKESQDIAVIELEKNGIESAVIQIIGDEDLYGEEMIVEPDSGAAGNSMISDVFNSSTHGPSAYTAGVTPIIVNVWLWPSVRFVYGTAYRPWVSPWRWNHYPGWYRPWRPFAWSVWHPRRVHYHRPFVIVHTHRVVRAHAVYRPVRVSSVTVRTKHAKTVNNYRVTRKKTTVTGPRGNTATRTKTTVKRKRGKRH